MPGAVRIPPRPRVPRVTLLNTDGRRHPAENSMTWFTLVTGVASFVLGLYIRNVPAASYAVILAATVTGLASLAVGLFAQMISVTRPQRVLIVTGLLGGFVGVSLGLAHGGLF
ncbi:MAG TPA: hypothetical protein VKV80_11315 [Streptosporangiaceae bacterium]|nr:hypothetical protein [Streptosporangiaceae bacterium]